MVISFGLTNAPVTFQAFINNVLKKYLDIFIIMYFNDILIYSRTEEEHKQHINQIFVTADKDIHRSDDSDQYKGSKTAVYHRISQVVKGVLD